MALTGVGDIARARQEGRYHSCTFRKVPSQASTALNWADLSMAAGNPPPNYYAATPLVASNFDGFRGLFHGDDKSPRSMHLTSLSVMTPTANVVGQLLLLDYLLYYPFIDGDAAGEEQTFDNTITIPDYATDDVMAMVVAVAPTTGGGSFTIQYTSLDDVERTSPVISCNTAVTNIASIVTSEQATVAGGKPFLPLVGDDRGIKRINSINMITASGGLFAIVLVKVITTIGTREVNTVEEIEFIRQKPGCPQIQDGSYLNFIINPTGSIATGILTGFADFAWSEE